MNRILAMNAPLVALWCLSSVASAQTTKPVAPAVNTPAVAPKAASAPKVIKPISPVAPKRVHKEATKKAVAKPTVPVKKAAALKTTPAASKAVTPNKSVPAAVKVNPAVAPGTASSPKAKASAKATPAVAVSTSTSTSKSNKSPAKASQNKVAPKAKSAVASKKAVTSQAVAPKAIEILSPRAPSGGPSTGTPSAAAVPQDSVVGLGSMSERGRPMFTGWMGVGTTIVTTDGFDAFSKDDALTGFSLGLGYSPMDLLPSGFSIIGMWERASTKADLRGEDTALTAQRFALGFEVRAQLFDRLDYYLRFAGTGLRIDAELEESSSGSLLNDRLWTYGIDATAGLQVHLLQIPTKNAQVVNLFARAEGGYLWLSQKDLLLGDTSDGAPVRLEPVKMTALDMGGDQFRFALGISY